jgi:Tol biopolymer transport system component
MLLADHRFDFYAQYSPNGRRIEFTSDRGGILGAIWVMPATGGKPRRVTPARLEASVATWTPDGRHLVTGTHCCEAGGNLYRIGIDGHHLVRLTSAAWPRGAGGPAYSPDGRRLAFNSNLARSADSPDIDLFTMRPDGTHVRRIEKAVQPIVVISWGRVPAPARTERAAR